MSTKLIPLSVRISQDDADYIAQLDIPDANTPSEKLRALISQSRQRQMGQHDFDSFMRLVRELISPSLQNILSIEHKEQMHSELISRFGEWLPATFSCLASFQTDGKNAKEELMLLERELADRLILLTGSILQLGVTSSCPCYDAELIGQRIEPLIELALMINQKNNKGDNDE